MPGPPEDVAPPPTTLDALMAYRWPGNIRELENVVKRMLLLGTEAGIPLENAPVTEQPGLTSLPGRSSDLKEVSRRAAREAERQLIADTLKQTRWNRAEAARRLGISYKALLYKSKACGVVPSTDKG